MNQSIEYMYLSLLCKEQQFNLVAIYFHNDQTIIDTYLRYIQSCFDGVVIIDMSQNETVNCEIFDNPKLLAYIKSNSDKSDLLKVITDSISCQWMFLLYNDEILYMQRHLCEKINDVLINEKIVCQINKIYSPNNEHYYKLEESTNGIEHIDRIYSTSLLSEYGYNLDIIDARIVRENTPVIIIQNSLSNRYNKLDINILTETALISSLYYKDNSFHNYTDIQTDRIEQKINLDIRLIADLLMNRKEMLVDWDLHNGEAGIVLLFSQLYLHTHNKHYLNQLVKSINHSIQLINKNWHSIPISYYRLADIVWLLCYIQECELMDVDEDYLKEIDEILTEFHSENTDYTWCYIDGRLSMTRYFRFIRNLQ